MVNIETYNGQKVVDSYELYIKMGLHKSSYSRWIRNTLKITGKDIDYFEVLDLLKRNKKVKRRHYFTLEMARALSIKTLTVHSKKINAFLKMEAMKE